MESVQNGQTGERKTTVSQIATLYKRVEQKSTSGHTPNPTALIPLEF